MKQHQDAAPGFPATSLACSLSIEDFQTEDHSFCRILMDNVPDLVWAKDMDGRFVFANQAMRRTLLAGKEPLEPLGKTNLFFARQDADHGLRHTLAQACIKSDTVVKARREPCHFVEDGYVRGEYLVLDVNKAPLFNREGEIVGIVGCARNITREKLTEERFQGMVDTMPVPVCEYGFDGALTFANQAALDWFGCTREALRAGLNIFDFVPASFCQTVEKGIELLAKGRCPEPLEMDFNSRQKDVLHGIAYPAPVWEGETVVKIRTCFLDLTGYRRAEADLKESEVRFRALFNGLNDAVFVHPFEKEGFGRFTEVNDSACEMYGYTRDEMIRLSPWALIAGSNRPGFGSRSDRDQLMEMGRRTIEMTHQKKNGMSFPVEVMSSVFKFHGEQLILTTVRDITERKRREQEQADTAKFRAEQEKYALVGQVAGKMAHDFNNILGGIMGNAEISLEDCRQPEIAKALNIILKQALQGRNLTRNLVAFAKDQEPKETYFCLNEKIDLVLNLLKKELSPINVVRRYAADLPQLLADPGMIEHALVNLVQNAVHALSRQPSPKLEIRTRSKNRNLVVEIQDNGCGIPARHQKDIYGPSFTLKGSKDILGAYGPRIKGTGYGMSNVKKYIEKHKGTVSFTSTESVGSCFVLTLPVREKQLTQKEKRCITQRIVVKEKRILLVEDEPAISGVQQKILCQDPFFHQVVTAQDATSAMALFSRGRYDLVSLDYILPGHLTGLDVYRHIRSLDNKIPVVFISGNIGVMESMKNIRENDRFIDYLAKPCENMLYADTINTWLLKAD